MMGKMVSVIVPVYNVEKYIDVCFETLVNQTYKSVEIIVIDDGSTDHSGDLCAKWAQKEQLVYLSKENEGLGPTRNLGVQMAHGDYIMFVDPDDWLALDAIEVMVDCMHEGISDVVTVTGYYEFNNRTEELKEVWQDEVVGLEPICEETRKRIYLLRGFVMMWGKLFRRDFLLENEIVIPDVPYEDAGVFPEIVFNARQIDFCSKPVYYYRANRQGSIITNIANRIYMSDACENFMVYFQNRNMLTFHYAGIKRFMEKELYCSYDLYCQYEPDLEKQKIVYNKFSQIHQKYFAGQKAYREYSFCLVGSFGSRWVIHELGINRQQLACHIPFSSIIAQMVKGETDEYSIYNQNQFRIEKIKADIEGELYSVLEDDSCRTDYFFIDFLEERYDVAELEDGNYITLSEALEDSIVEKMNMKRVIKAGSEEHFEIWKQKCKKLVGLIKKRYTYEQIILIKSRLAIQYLSDGVFVEYQEGEILKKKNAMIEKMEDYFLRQMEDKIQVYAYPDNIYSEKSFRMGAEPQYLSELFYKKMGAEISAFLH